MPNKFNIELKATQLARASEYALLHLCRGVKIPLTSVVKSAGAVEYTDCISARAPYQRVS